MLILLGWIDSLYVSVVRLQERDANHFLPDLLGVQIEPLKKAMENKAARTQT